QYGDHDYDRDQDPSPNRHFLQTSSSFRRNTRPAHSETAIALCTPPVCENQGGDPGKPDVRNSAS
ncbi:hypothetical protein, partial [Rhodococcus opacus]|uniref:hypothetical protein n=1 Tax=Rhodococcus opacus TaxID=37919 RepID=UPI001A7E0CF4